MDLKELLSSLSSPGDLAAASLGYASGFVIDVFFFPEGLGPGTVAGVTAIGTLGAKKSVEALTPKLTSSIRNKLKRSRLEKTLSSYLQGESLTELEQRLISNRNLWKQGLLEEEEFVAELEKIRQDCVSKVRDQLNS